MANTDGAVTIDAAGAAAFLAERSGGPIDRVAPIQQGEWSRAFFFRQAGQEYVIRFGAYLEDFAKDRLAARYRAPGLPIPDVVAIGEGLGGYYAISERLLGAYIDGVDQAQMRALLPSLFAALDAMRQADLSGTTGYGPWDAEGHAPYSSWQAALLDVGEDRPGDRVAGWRERLVASPTGAEPFDTALRRLRSLVADLPESRHLIHSDLLHYNVLVSGARISAVFDWGCAKYGDFLYDLAWFCFWSLWFPAWAGIDFRQEALAHVARIGLDVPAFEERLLACQIHIGLDGMAYQAYKGYWSDLETTARRTLAISNIIA